MACKPTRLLVVILLVVHACADFLYPAGNWTHSTNLFSALHFVPGYNRAGEWDVLTGGNWTPTNHSDANLIGDAAIYMCPCPQPPCQVDPGPPKPGYNSSVFACLESSSRNLSHAVCTVFHADRTNITCVTPSHAIVCDIPKLDAGASLYKWWENDEVPAHSYFSVNVTAISCLIRDDIAEVAVPPELLNFSDAMVLQRALAVERCEIQCRGVCETVCVTEHQPASAVAPQLDDWIFDAEVDNNPREFVTNNTLYSENHPAQYLRGAVPRTYGREVEPKNMTCTMPTMEADRHTRIFGGLPGNLSAMSGLFDLYGRRFNAMNVFDLTLYVALQALKPLEGLQCVTPFPNASALDPLPGETTSYLHSLVCHQPTLTPYNVSLGPAPVYAATSSSSSSRRELLQQPQESVAADRLRLAREAAEEAQQDELQRAGEQRAELQRDEPLAGERATPHPLESIHEGLWDQWHWDPNGDGTNWDWRHALTIRDARNNSHWTRRWRAAGRRPPRRRLLYHEFEIARSPWDYWLDESPAEHHARIVRRHAQLTGDCRFYHNCTDPLPPPLLLRIFECWWANVTAQPNVSIVPPRSLDARPSLHGVNENTTYGLEAVSCIQPSWPNSTSISCVTSSTALTCPYTDSYRGNESALLAAGSAYYNESSAQCTAWPILDVYRHAANAGLLFSVASNGTHREAYLDPWERPSDYFTRVAVGKHHYCAVDEFSVLRCTGHNIDGRSSLFWPDQSATPPLTIDAVDAVAVSLAEGMVNFDSEQELEARRRQAIREHQPNRTLDMCTGDAHTCAIEEVRDYASGNLTGRRVVCWGSNYSATIDIERVSSYIAMMPLRGDPAEVRCGARFVCVLQHVPTQEYPTVNNPNPPTKGYYPYCMGIVQDRNQGFDHTLPSSRWPMVSATDQSIGRFDHFEVGANHACGIRTALLYCYGNYPPIPASLGIDFALVGLAIGATHTCAGINDGTFGCFSGTGSGGPVDASWLEAVVGQPTGTWDGVASITLADSIACVTGLDGQAYCGGERGQDQLHLIHPPIMLQPETIDLLERGMSFSQVQCGGKAARNESFVQLGEQYCCGINHAHLVHCWGILPPHGGMHLPREDLNPQGTRAIAVPYGYFEPLNESNYSVFHIRSRRRVYRTRYLRDFALKVLLDTQPSMSAAEVTVNFSQPFVCHNVPRRVTQNVSDWAAIWLGVNISNISAPVESVRSWHMTMLLVLQLAAYTDGLSCFNFTHPFPDLHCARLLPYVNRTVEVVTQPPKPFTIEKLSANDLLTTKYSLSHTLQPDNYCFEKLRLTPSEQFRRGAAWHRATQRLVDGFEILLSFQISNAALLCKTVRALVTGTLLYEQCVHSGSDGFALLLRGGGPPSALGAGGASMGYGGLNRTLAIEFDTWHNHDMGDDLYYNHVSVQTGGPTGPIGAHREHYISSAYLDPDDYPLGFTDGKAHLARIVYTPGFDVDKLAYGPSPSHQHLRYWVKEGAIAEDGYPHGSSVGTWARPGVGVLQVYLDAMAKPLLALPIDIGYTLGLDNGRAWVGLSAATGRRFQNHFVLGWQLCEGPAGCERPMTSCEAFGCNPIYPSARHEPSAEEASIDPSYADLARGIAARPRRYSGTNLPAAATRTAPYRDGREAFDDAPDERSWGAEPDSWSTPLRPFDTSELWPGGGDRFTSSVMPDGQVQTQRSDDQPLVYDPLRPLPAAADGVVQPFLGSTPGQETDRVG